MCPFPDLGDLTLAGSRASPTNTCLCYHTRVTIAISSKLFYKLSTLYPVTIHDSLNVGEGMPRDDAYSFAVYSIVTSTPPTVMLNPAAYLKLYTSPTENEVPPPSAGLVLL